MAGPRNVPVRGWPHLGMVILCQIRMLQRIVLRKTRIGCHMPMLALGLPITLFGMKAGMNPN